MMKQWMCNNLRTGLIIFLMAFSGISLGDDLGATSVAAVVSAQPISPGERVALVIGNAQYPKSPLKNSVNDARVMAKKLKDLGERGLRNSVIFRMKSKFLKML